MVEVDRPSSFSGDASVRSSEMARARMNIGSDAGRATSRLHITFNKLIIMSYYKESIRMIISVQSIQLSPCTQYVSNF